MTVRAVVVVLLAASTVAACGSSDTDAASPPTESVSVVAAPQPTSPPYPDSPSLAAAMIGVSDLPLGYTAVELPPRDELPESADPGSDLSGTDPAACSSVLATVASQFGGSAADASVTFSGPDFSSVDADAASYDGDGAPRAFDAVQQTFARCASFSGTDADGVDVDYTVGALAVDPSTLPGDSAEPLADASTFVTVTIESSGVTLVSDVLLAVVGSTVVQLVVTGRDTTDAVLLHDLATTVVERLRR